MDVLEGDTTEGVFTVVVAGVAGDPDHNALKIPLSFWCKEMGQLATEVRTHDGQDTTSANLVDKTVDQIFARIDLVWRPVGAGIERLGDQE